MLKDTFTGRDERLTCLGRVLPRFCFKSLLSLSSSDLRSSEDWLSFMSSFSWFSTFRSRGGATWPARALAIPVTHTKIENWLINHLFYDLYINHNWRSKHTDNGEYDQCMLTSAKWTLSWQKQNNNWKKVVQKKLPNLWTCLPGGWAPSWRWDQRWPASRRGCCSGWWSLRGEQSPVRTDNHKYMRQRTEQNIKSPSDHEAIWSVPRKQKWFTLNRGRDRSWTSKLRVSLCCYCRVWPPLWRTEWCSHYKEWPSQTQICAQRLAALQSWVLTLFQQKALMLFSIWKRVSILWEAGWL